MKIKYRLVLLFIFIILISTLPLALIILDREEKEKIALITDQGMLNCRVLARSTMNILMANGGDIATSRVDAREMMAIFTPLARSGLVHADCAVVSARPDTHGIVLARYSAPGFSGHGRDRIDPGEMERLTAGSVMKVVSIPGVTGRFYEFAAPGFPAGKDAICLGRLVFSEEEVLKPISRVRRLMYVLIAAAILLVSVVALVASRFLSRPIEELTEGVSKIDVGDLGQKLPVRGRGEIAKLATTFNHMLTMIDLHLSRLVETNRELRRLDALKDEFLANTSHELRTPVSGMIGLAESLLAGSSGPVDESARRDLELIVQSGRRLSRLVGDILDFSRLKNSDISLELASVDLHTVAELVFSVLRPVMERKGIQARNLLESGKWFAEADPNRLQQIIMNLAGNAVKFTERGSVSISARNDENGMIAATVEDTGPGIPADSLSRIFEPFEQADGSISRTHGGTGLGLTIVKKLVELHGGAVSVQSEEGRGARFTFTLHRATPAGDTARAVLPAEPTTTSPSIIEYEVKHPGSPIEQRKIPGSHTILVVDDDPVILRVLDSYLSLEGYSVVTALSGSEALEIIGSGAAPDLIILDVMLPRISGYDVARAVREKHPSHELPIIMLTAKNMPADAVTGISAGANDFLVKPVGREELAVRVNNLVAMKESAREHRKLDVLKRDLDIAHEIQQSLILRTLPEIRGASIAVRYQAMAELGGDFYDIHPLADGMLAVLIADVSGHGIAAALICSMLRVAYAFHLGETTDPATLMERINATMGDLTHGQFITALFAAVDIPGRKLSCASAGHWPVALLRDTGETVDFPADTGIPFGWDPAARYAGSTLELRPGDRIVFFTDGLVECRDQSNDMFGTERMIQASARERAGSPEECAESILSDLRAWHGSTGFDDDVTLIIIDID
ncbi:MAG TPA: SpoIIE family protein phosphatase [Spirochaetota bacterium]|nr:SpoIIE family protein phosphatase [Spirochaetota bacterium]